MKTVGIGLIGCGARLQWLFESLSDEKFTTKLVAICDPREEAIEQGLKKFNPQAKVCKDYRELVKDPAIDWVFIGSWNCFHREHAVAALEAGKHVFCEKPLATNLKDCLAMRDAWQKSGKIFFLGFTLRYSPLYTTIRQLLDEGAIGKIISMESNETLDFKLGGFIHCDWRRLEKNAGTFLLEKCCHDIDLATWMVGSLPVRVASFGGTDFFRPENAWHMERVGKSPDGEEAFMSWLCPSCPEGGTPFNLDKDIIDNQVAILQFTNGVRSTFHINCCAAINERRMYIIGSEGTIRSDFETGAVEVKRYGWDDQRNIYNCARMGGHGGSDSILIKQIAESIRSEKASISGLMEGLKSAIICFATDESMKTGAMVDVRPLWEQAGIEVY